MRAACRKLTFIENNLYGVDVDISAIELAKLRLWLSLVIEEESFEKIKPLPNLDYKLIQGNSVVERIGNVNFEKESSDLFGDLISKDISISTLVVFWQFILKGIEELSIVTNPILSLEMLAVRLIHLKDMPSFEKTLESLTRIT